MEKDCKLTAVTSAAYWLARLTNGTLRRKIKNEELIDELQAEGKTVIFAFWHGHLWFPVYYWQDRGYVGLASESRDGEYISRILRRFGWQVVRGSTSRGGARSIIKLIRRLQKGKAVVITPDGPTGPRHEVKSGVVYLAQKTESAIVPVGISFSRRKVFSSWDKFELPWPFAKAGLVYGSPIQVTEELTAPVKEKYQGVVKEALEAANREAEQLLED